MGRANENTALTKPRVLQDLLLRCISGRWIVTGVVRMPRICGFVLLLLAAE